MVSIRLAVVTDMSNIADLHVRSWQSAYVAEFARERLHGDIKHRLLRFWRLYKPGPADVIAVACDGDDDQDVLGLCAIWCKGEPYLDNLHVLPTAKGRGIGRAIMSFAAQELARRGYQSLSLSVFTANHQAREFYRRLGGVETGQYDQDVFGQLVPSTRLRWDDLEPLINAN